MAEQLHRGMRAVWNRIIGFLCGICVFVIPLVEFHLAGLWAQTLLIVFCALLAAAFAWGRPCLLNKLRKYVLIFTAVWACAVFLGRFSGTLIPCDMPEGACRNPGIHGKVLVLIPHEDDEINLMGGVFELLRDDCEIWVVFSTNGVGTGKPVRNAEACRALAQFGIPADHVLFLGFDVMPLRGAGTHLYNRPRNEVTTSRYRRDVTWSPSGFPCHTPNLPYTQANFEGDIKDIIAALKPEHVFITGYDLHPDHRALDLSAKRALAVIMKGKSRL